MFWLKIQVLVAKKSPADDPTFMDIKPVLVTIKTPGGGSASHEKS